MTFGCSCAILDEVSDAKNVQLRDSKISKRAQILDGVQQNCMVVLLPWLAHGDCCPGEDGEGTGAGKQSSSEDEADLRLT